MADDEKSELFQFMSEHAKNACRKAYSELCKTCKQIASGKVTMDTLKLIRDNESRVCRLCKCADIEFEVQQWVKRLRAVEEYLQTTQVLHNFLNEKVEGKYTEANVGW